jgi:hypothetical protein
MEFFLLAAEIVADDMVFGSPASSDAGRHDESSYIRYAGTFMLRIQWNFFQNRPVCSRFG